MKRDSLRGKANLQHLRQNVFIQGRPGLTALRGFAWLSHCLVRRSATIELWPSGPRMQLQPHLTAYGSTSLYMKRLGYEPQLRVLAGQVCPGDVVLDIGANFGVYALTLASHAGPGGIVHAFEPGREALAQLRRNCAVLNPNLPVSIWDTALSDVNQMASLHHIGGAPTTFSLAGSGHEGSEGVRAVTLDSWCSERQLTRLDLVKIDVEGHEPRAFAGGLETLKRFKPLIMFEVSTSALARSGSTPREAFTALASLGYRIHALRGSTLEQVSAPEDGNLFAVHPEGRPLLPL